MSPALVVPSLLLLLVGDPARPPAEADSRGPELRRAAQQGDVVLVRRLLRVGVDPDTADGNGRTAVVAAAAAGQAAVVKELVKAGADPDLRDREWGTALDAAGRHGHDEVVRVLREAGARGSGKSPGDTVCVRPWSGQGFCGQVEAVQGSRTRLRLGRIVGCADGCAPMAECSEGRPVGGASPSALGVGDDLWLRGECLTDVGVRPDR